MDRILRIALFFAVMAVVPAPAAATDAPPSGFARIARDAHGAPVALQMAIATYVPATGPADVSVDLISAVHIGDAAYYEGLNERFRGYDALLFEMVVPDEAGSASKSAASTSWIGGLQTGLTDLLDLAYQLDAINYDAPNFVHADLSTGMLADSMRERNESIYVYFWRLVFASLEQYRQDPLGSRGWRLYSALLAGEGDALKIVVAEELLASLDSGAFFGGENGSAIIDARNEHAIGVLQQQLDGGADRVGIFYGVGHMADFEQRLRALGLVRTNIEWVDAWRFAEAPTAGSRPSACVRDESGIARCRR